MMPAIHALGSCINPFEFPFPSSALQHQHFSKSPYLFLHKWVLQRICLVWKGNLQEPVEKQGSPKARDRFPIHLTLKKGLQVCLIETSQMRCT